MSIAVAVPRRSRQYGFLPCTLTLALEAFASLPRWSALAPCDALHCPKGQNQVLDQQAEALSHLDFIKWHLPAMRDNTKKPPEESMSQ